MKTIKRMLLVVMASLMFAGTAMAEMGAAHKVVIQVSSADAKPQTIALNNAVNVQKHYGSVEVDVGIVAYGAGLSILTLGKKNKNACDV